MTRARALEAGGQLREAIQTAQPHAERLPEAFVTGNLNLVIGRCALALGDQGSPGSRWSAWRSAATSTAGCSWDRQASLAAWGMALKSGDSRVVRFAER